ARGAARPARLRRSLLAVLAGVAFAAGVEAGSGAGAREQPERPHVPREVRAAVERFLDRSLLPNGRVTRRDEGGDTVSEGQAYALLATVAVGDERRFARVWSWTRHHLLRSDGTLAWLWKDGRVISDGPAADADLDAARALALAADRFDRPAYAAAARRLGRALLREQTTRAVGTLVLVAGPWARANAVINPSYFSPRAYTALRGLDGDRRWRTLERSSARLTRALLEEDGAALPPDWAKVLPWGVVPVGPPGAQAAATDAAYSYDAVRMPVRYAESCTASDRALAARPWPALHAQATAGGGYGAAVTGLDGAPRERGAH
ncbi:glycosyl hydrolase family 8, partial [Conexibacter stalactiti]